MTEPSAKLSETFGMNQAEQSLLHRGEAYRTNVRHHSESGAGQSVLDIPDRTTLKPCNKLDRCHPTPLLDSQRPTKSIQCFQHHSTLIAREQNHHQGCCKELTVERSAINSKPMVQQRRRNTQTRTDPNRIADILFGSETLSHWHALAFRNKTRITTTQNA